MVKLTRREVMVAGAALAAARCNVSPGDPAIPGFPLGIAAGDPTIDSVILWTKWDGAEQLRALVWADGQTEADARVFDVEPLDGFVHLDVQQLQPDTLYRYAFVASGARSTDGRFRTLPRANSRRRVRIGATSCTRYGVPFDPLARAAERGDLDAFVMLGDSVYCDGAHTREQFRKKWHETMATSEYRALKASTAVIASWDDHEFNNDWTAENIEPDRFLNAADTFYENLPVRRNEQHPYRIWRNVKFGDTVELFMIDGRSERRKSIGQYLSREQMEWLENGLRTSTAAFKVVINPVPLAVYETPFFQPFARDRWEGFPKARDRMLNLMDKAGMGRGVLWVAGDFHLASIGRLDTKGPCCDTIEVLVGPGGQTANSSPSYPSAPQFDWSSGINNFGLFDFDVDRGTVKLDYVNGQGEVFHSANLQP